MADHLRYDFPDPSVGLLAFGRTIVLPLPLPCLRVHPFFVSPSLHDLLLAFFAVLVLLFAVVFRLASRQTRTKLIPYPARTCYAELILQGAAFSRLTLRCCEGAM